MDQKYATAAYELNEKDPERSRFRYTQDCYPEISLVHLMRVSHKMRCPHSISYLL